MDNNTENEKLIEDTSAQELSWKVKIFYGLPDIGATAYFILINIYLTDFYVNIVKIDIIVISSVVAIGRLVDLVCDPAIGWMSDRTVTRFGRRKPWMAIAAPISGISLILLFKPPLDWPHDKLVIWFSITYLLVFVSYTFMYIPYLGLGPELVRDYKLRSSLYGWRDFFKIIGVMVTSFSPAFVSNITGRLSDGLFVVTCVLSGVLVISFWLLVLLVPEKEHLRPTEVTEVQKMTNSEPFVSGLGLCLRNLPFLIVLVSSIFSNFSGSITNALTPFYVNYVLQPPPEEADINLGMLLMSYSIGGIVWLPVAVYCAKRYSKWIVWVAGLGVGVIANACIIMITPETPSNVLIACAISAFQGAAFWISLYGILTVTADAIDYDRMRTGMQREGVYSSLGLLANKITAVPAVAISITLLYYSGYIPGEAPNIQPRSAIDYLKYTNSLIPAICYLLAMCVAVLYPITPEMHKTILDYTTALDNGDPALVDPITRLTIERPKYLTLSSIHTLNNFSLSVLQRYLRFGFYAFFIEIFLHWLISGTLGMVGAVYLGFNGLIWEFATFVIIGVGISWSYTFIQSIRLIDVFAMKNIPVDDIRIYIKHNTLTPSCIGVCPGSYLQIQ